MKTLTVLEDEVPESFSVHLAVRGYNAREMFANLLDERRARLVALMRDLITVDYLKFIIDF